MNPRILGRMATQHGLITRQQALELGLSPDEVRRLLAHGDWVAIRRGVYALACEWEALDRWVGQPRLRSLAASLNMSRDHVLSHDSAADVHGLPLLRAEPDLVHVTRDRVLGSRTRHGVKHHGAPFLLEQVVEVNGVRILDLARTGVDIAREHGFRHGLVACDGALRLGVRREQLLEAAEPMRSWPNKRVVDQVIELADAGAETVGETLGRELVLELGIGMPETQFELRDDERHVRCDLRVGRHLFEFDGVKKYLSLAAGGVSEDPDALRWAEKRRQDWLSGHRLGVSRIVWSDCFGTQRARAKQRLLREFDQTCRLWGTSIDDLAHLVVRRNEL